MCQFMEFGVMHLAGSGLRKQDGEGGTKKCEALSSFRLLKFGFRGDSDSPDLGKCFSLFQVVEKVLSSVTDATL